jgi:hypothetical protein
MALVPIDSLRRQVLHLLKKTAPCAGVELLSYKRDRSIVLLCLEDGHYQVFERGFTDQNLIVDAVGLPRLLKTLIRREFPRSHKVRLLKFSSLDELKPARRSI